MDGAGDPAISDAPAFQRLFGMGTHGRNRKNAVIVVAQQNGMTSDVEPLAGVLWQIGKRQNRMKVSLVHAGRLTAKDSQGKTVRLRRCDISGSTPVWRRMMEGQEQCAQMSADAVFWQVCVEWAR